MNTRQNAHTARLKYHVNLTFTFQFFDQGVIRRDEENNIAAVLVITLVQCHKDEKAVS